MNKLLMALLLCSSQSIVLSMSQEQLNEALIEASKKGNVEQIKSHLKAGAEVNTQDAFGRTPLHYAVRFWSEIPLHSAAGVGFAIVVRLLLQAGANVNARDGLGRTPLHYATIEHAEVVKLLLQAGANINAQDKWGGTPLHLAAMRGHLEVAQVLVEKGAQVNANFTHGTPLQSAVYHEHIAMARFLLNQGANPNLQTNEGLTCLHYTAMGGNKEITKLLLENGADATIKSKGGLSPADFDHPSDVEMIRLLDDYTELQVIKKNEQQGKKLDYNDLLLKAAVSGNSVIIQYLLTNMLWSKDVLEQALAQAKVSYYVSAQDKTYQEIGRMLLKYLHILGPQGLIATKGLALPLPPEELKQVIASQLFKLGMQ